MVTVSKIIHLPDAFSDMNNYGLPHKPINRVRFLEALRGDGLYFITTLEDKHRSISEDQIRISLALADEATWFDFGEISLRDIVQPSDEAKRFREKGEMQFPFEATAFRMRLTGQLNFEYIFLIFDGVWESYRAHHYKAKGKDVVAITSQIDISTDSLLITYNSLYGPSKEADLVTHLIDGLWMILNTKSVRQNIVEAPTRLNKHRVARGKIPITKTIYIRFQDYVNVRDQPLRTRIGISPHKHKRRAHTRKLGDKIINIPEMIVNKHKPGPILQKDYKVIR